MFIPPIYGDLGEGLWHCFNHMTICKNMVGIYKQPEIPTILGCTEGFFAGF
jgi:hypothetical protein